MIAVYDYGAGNLRSVGNTLSELGIPFGIVQDPAALRLASKIILPGVGHFGQMMQAIPREVFVERIRAGIPFLGICLGLQALLERSEEAPGLSGLGIFPGEVRRFQPPLRVPHMGWNTVTPVAASRLIPESQHFYFANSYYAPVLAETSATCEYGEPFTAAIEHRNIFAVQFHPEKSGPAGLAVVRRFAEAAC